MVNDPVLFESVLTHQSTRRGAACAAACAVALARARSVACATATAVTVAGPTVTGGLAYGGLLRKVPDPTPWRAGGGRNAGVLLTVAPTPTRGALSSARTKAATAVNASAAQRRTTPR